MKTSDPRFIRGWLSGLGILVGLVGSAACANEDGASEAVASVTVAPASVTVTVGATAQLSVELKDSAGNVLTGRTVAWSSANPAVAAVNASGLVTGVAAGSTEVTATSEGQSGTATVTVSTVPVASVTVSPTTASLIVGQSIQLSAQARDASGNVLTGRAVTWASSNTNVASVTGTGLVTAVASGSAEITATSEGRSGSADVTVSAPASGTVNVDAGAIYQTMTGWAVGAGIGQFDFEPVEYLQWRDAALDSAVALGLTRIRVAVRSGFENTTDYWAEWRAGNITRQEWRDSRYQAVNDNGDPNSINPAGFQFAELDETITNIVVPLRDRLAAEGKTLVVDLTFVDFAQSTFDQMEDPDEYAEFMLAMFQHVQSTYGWAPDGIEMILEPDNPGWNGTVVGQALAATGARLAGAGFTPQFIAPSNTNMATSITDFDLMIQVPGVSQYLTLYSYHRYSGVSDANTQAIGDRAVQHSVGTTMSEHIGSDHVDLLKDLTLARNSTWTRAALAFPLANDTYADYFIIDRATAQVSLAPSARGLRQYFKFVQPGALRVGSTSSNGQLHPIAFVNADGNYVVVVRADGGVNFTIGGLPSGTYGATYTTSAGYGLGGNDITIGAGQALATGIPAAGVITVYGKN